MGLFTKAFHDWLEKGVMVISEFYFWDDMKKFVKVSDFSADRILTVNGTFVYINEVPYFQFQLDIYYEYSEENYEKLVEYLKTDFVSEDVESVIENEFFNDFYFYRLDDWSNALNIEHIYEVR